MRVFKYLIPLLIGTSLYAQDSDYIGTRSDPIPLKGGVFGTLNTITIYLYQDTGFEITDNGISILKGTFTNSEDSISYSDHTAFSNKVYIEHNLNTYSQVMGNHMATPRRTYRAIVTRP